MADADEVRESEQATTVQIAERLRELIRRGRVVPGQRLIEADLIRDLGAPRSKVREALQRLATEGLVVIEEHRGASVRQIGRDEVRQIYRTRMVLEGIAAADFAAADAPDLKARLAAIQAEMERVDGTGDHTVFARLNAEWHALIIEGSGNDYIRQFVSQLTVPIHRLLFSTFYKPQRIQDANGDHRLITAAIVEGRVAHAEHAMRSHIAHGLAALAEIQSHFDS